MTNDDQNKDREEDDFFGDDEDFGLPELDYEALDDDAEEAKEEPAEAPADEPKAEADTTDVDDDDDFSDMEDAFGDDDMDAAFGDDDMDNAFGDDNMDDAFGDGNTEEEEIPDQVDDAEVEAEMANDSTDADDFMSEESFDDFDGSDDSFGDEDGEEIPDSVFDSDVLDEDEFKQFEKELMETEQGEMEGFDDMDSFDDGGGTADDDYAPVSSGDDGKSKGKFARVVIIGIVVFTALGIVFWQLRPSGGEGEEQVAENTEKPVVKQPAKKEEEEAKPEATPAKEDDNQAASTASTQQPAQQRPASTSTQRPANNNRPKTTPVAQNPGEINALSARTNSFYIVIASFVDGDLAMDYSKELAATGKSPYIIPPFGKAITHRVAISGYGTLAQAQGAVEGFKTEYGQDIWILKY